MTPRLTRRDFLKLGGAGLLGLLLAEIDTRAVSALGASLSPAMEFPSVRQGRVAYSRISSYATPSRDGIKVGTYKKDTVLTIIGDVTGGTPDDYNRRWYRIGAAEYIYSGGIQPVQNSLNITVTDLPGSGGIGEVTVPYVDSWWGINRRPFPGVRLYYATTHWIQALVADERDGSLWYQAYDHLYNASYYIPSTSIRILPAQEVAPLSPQVPGREKYIEVRLDEQVLLAFEGEDLAFSCRVSTGRGEFATPEGWFTTFHKRPTAHMVGGESDAALYDLSGVPWDTYITENGVAMHGTFWHNDYGTPRSHGCINLTPRDAKRIYRWTQPAVPPDKRFLYQPGQGTDVQVIRSGSF